MPTAKLLLRHQNVDSLSAIVEKSQLQKPPYAEYDLRLNSCQLDIVLTSKPPIPPRPFPPKPQPADEGFESDIDSLSIISSDDSSTCGPSVPSSPNHSPKSAIRETDSANGSSDSDTEVVPTAVPPQPSIPLPKPQIPITPISGTRNFETHNLVDCVCYKDIKFPNLLVFVIKRETFVFLFDSVETLDAFYTNFTTFKAVTNQKTYSKNLGAKFNLLHRTDNNGITHIEIAREPEAQIIIPDNRDSSIISISTPDNLDSGTLRSTTSNSSKNTLVERRLKNIPRIAGYGSYNSLTLKPSYESRQLSEIARYNTLGSGNGPKSLPSFALKSASTENLLELTEFPKSKSVYDENRLGADKNEENVLRKVWKSAEDLLDAPTRPARRRKPKGKAPPPPVVQSEPSHHHHTNSMQGQFVKVNIDPKKDAKPVSSGGLKGLGPKLQTFTSKSWNFLPQKSAPTIVLTTKPQIQSYQHHFNEQKPMYYVQNQTQTHNHTSRQKQPQESWTNSVPRLLRKPRSRSETRNFTPMAYRYIDTTSQNPMPPVSQNTHTISNRLFGLSQKLKDFNGPSSMGGNGYDGYQRESRRGSMGDYCYRGLSGSGENTLKSVIKKQDDKKSKNNDKKVTFSAYTTVQVV